MTDEHFLTIAIDPCSPLVFRSGKPFGDIGQSGSAEGFEFPAPGTIAGAVRAAYADAVSWEFKDQGKDKKSHRRLVESVSVEGPLLAWFGRDHSVSLLVPKPADAFYYEDNRRLFVQALRPRQAKFLEERCDLPSHLMSLSRDGDVDPQKPAGGPAYWYLDQVVRWLIENGQRSTGGVGLAGPVAEVRQHVTLDADRLAHVRGQFYESAGRDFGSTASGNGGWDPPMGLVARLRVAESEQAPGKIVGHMRRVGADGRQAVFRAGGEWPGPDGNLVKKLAELERGDVFRLLLVTPAIFENGWYPKWLAPNQDGYLEGEIPEANCQVRLVAAAVDRWRPYSGWSMAEGKQRAIRRMVPAGAVYWFQLLDAIPADWTKLWLRSVCSHDSIRNDGFGLVLPGLAPGVKVEDRAPSAPDLPETTAKAPARKPFWRRLLASLFPRPRA